MRRRRTITIAGRQVSPEEALRFEVVRGVLTGAMTLEIGAMKLAMERSQLLRLVNGARDAVIRALGENALIRAREQLAS